MCQTPLCDNIEESRFSAARRYTVRGARERSARAVLKIWLHRLGAEYSACNTRERAASTAGGIVCARRFAATSPAHSGAVAGSEAVHMKGV